MGADPRTESGADVDEGFDVYLYDDPDDGAAKLERGFPTTREAIRFAREQITSGRFPRAIVGRGEKVVELWDSLDEFGSP